MSQILHNSTWWFLEHKKCYSLTLISLLFSNNLTTQKLTEETLHTIECRMMEKWRRNESHTLESNLSKNITCCNKCKVSNKATTSRRWWIRNRRWRWKWWHPIKLFHENKHFVYRSSSIHIQISSQTNLKGQFHFIEIAYEKKGFSHGTNFSLCFKFW